MWSLYSHWRGKQRKRNAEQCEINWITYLYFSLYDSKEIRITVSFYSGWLCIGRQLGSSVTIPVATPVAPKKVLSIKIIASLPAFTRASYIVFRLLVTNYTDSKRIINCLPVRIYSGYLFRGRQGNNNIIDFRCISDSTMKLTLTTLILCVALAAFLPAITRAGYLRVGNECLDSCYKLSIVCYRQCKVDGGTECDATCGQNGLFTNCFIQNNC
jgi:hypothetical protein